MGDFNATLNASERKGGACSTQASHNFQDFLFTRGLRDLDFHESEFTWSRRAIYTRLDQMLCNEKWDELFPETSVTHLFHMRSDQKPLLLKVRHARHSVALCQFRYFTGWRLHVDFDRMVANNWQSSYSLSDVISRFSSTIEVWTTTIFGYIGAKKRSIIAQLRCAQKALKRRQSSFLLSLERELCLELETLLDQEELLCQQKSRSEWINSGDRILHISTAWPPNVKLAIEFVS
ncbi:hypothetical protein V6N13_047898 [Hibiscus sabdariffa]